MNSKRTRQSFFRRALHGVVLASFLTGQIFSTPQALAQTATVLNLPLPGTMLGVSPGYVPISIKGVKIFPDNPFRFDFLLDTGHSKLTGDSLHQETRLLIKYFLTALTVPDEDQWVNLSPYEKDRIAPDAFGNTEMGRDLLAQDYLLKQLTASLLYPEQELGKRFWKRVYHKVYEQFEDVAVPVDTFNKVWVMPDHAMVYQNGNTAVIKESRLKVLLEEDYFATHDPNTAGTGRDRPLQDPSRELTRQVIREIVLPEIEREVNEGKTFAKLRQVYHSMVMAAWFKRQLKDSFLNKVYIGKNKVAGVDVDDKAIKQKIYAQYLEAFKKGVYNYIREDVDVQTQEVIPRKYFSGGVLAGEEVVRTTEVREVPLEQLTATANDLTGDSLAASVVNKPVDSSGSEIENPEINKSVKFELRIFNPSAEYSPPYGKETFEIEKRSEMKADIEKILRDLENFIKNKQENERFIEPEHMANFLLIIEKLFYNAGNTILQRLDNFRDSRDLKNVMGDLAIGFTYREDPDSGEFEVVMSDPGIGIAQKTLQGWERIEDSELRNPESSDDRNSNPYFSFSNADLAFVLTESVNKYRVTVASKQSHKPTYQFSQDYDGTRTVRAAKHERETMGTDVIIRGKLLSDERKNFSAASPSNSSPADLVPKVLSTEVAEQVKKMPAWELLSVLELGKAKTISERANSDGTKTRRIQIPHLKDRSKSPQGLEILRHELFNTTEFELLYNPKGYLIAIFPVIAGETSGSVRRKPNSRYFDFSEFYFEIPLMSDLEVRQKWEQLNKQILENAQFIDNYRAENAGIGFANVDRAYLYLNLNPFNNFPYIEEFSVEEYTDFIDKVKRFFPGAGSSSHAIIPIFPTVYHFDRNLIDDEQYFLTLTQRLNIQENHDVMVVGPGNGWETWFVSRKTDQKIYAVGINPFEVANTRATAKIGGYEVETKISDNIISEDGIPVFDKQFDRIIWNMPAYTQIVTKEQVEKRHLDWEVVGDVLIQNRWAQRLGHGILVLNVDLTAEKGRMEESFGRVNFEKLLPVLQQKDFLERESLARWHDGDYGGIIVKRFAQGLLKMLKQDGIAMIWNSAYGDGLEEVKKILEVDGQMEVAFEKTEMTASAKSSTDSAPTGIYFIRHKTQKTSDDVPPGANQSKKTNVEPPAGAMKRIGVGGDFVEPSQEIKTLWRIRATEVNDESIPITAVNGQVITRVDAKVIEVLPGELPEGWRSYYFKDDNGVMVIVLAPGQTEAIRLELIYHEDRERFWFELLWKEQATKMNGELSKIDIGRIGRDAHILAWVDEINAFSENGNLTPVQLAELSEKSQDALNELKDEKDRVYQDAVVKSRFSREELKKYQLNEKKFQERVMLPIELVTKLRTAEPQQPQTQSERFYLPLFNDEIPYVPYHGRPAEADGSNPYDGTQRDAMVSRINEMAKKQITEFLSHKGFITEHPVSFVEAEILGQRGPDEILGWWIPEFIKNAVDETLRRLDNIHDEKQLQSIAEKAGIVVFYHEYPHQGEFEIVISDSGGGISQERFNEWKENIFRDSVKPSLSGSGLKNPYEGHEGLAVKLALAEFKEHFTLTFISRHTTGTTHQFSQDYNGTRSVGVAERERKTTGTDVIIRGKLPSDERKDFSAPETYKFVSEEHSPNDKRVEFAVFNEQVRYSPYNSDSGQYDVEKRSRMKSGIEDIFFWNIRLFLQEKDFINQGRMTAFLETVEELFYNAADAILQRLDRIRDSEEQKDAAKKATIGFSYREYPSSGEFEIVISDSGSGITHDTFQDWQKTERGQSTKPKLRDDDYDLNPYFGFSANGLSFVLTENAKNKYQLRFVSKDISGDTYQFVQNPDGSRRVEPYFDERKSIGTDVMIRGPVASGVNKKFLVGAMKNLSVFDPGKPPPEPSSDLLAKWKAAARTQAVETRTIRGQLTQLKILTVDPSQMPADMTAYHFMDDAGILVVVMPSTITQDEIKEELIFHEVREAYWLERLSLDRMAGLEAADKQRALTAIKRDAHILAWADQIVEFGGEGFTPLQQQLLPLLSWQDRKGFIQENREHHDQLVRQYSPDSVRVYEKNKNSFIERLTVTSLPQRKAVPESSEDYLRFLVGQLDNPHFDVAHEADVKLRKLNDPRSIPLVLEKFRSAAPDADSLRKRIMYLLGAIGKHNDAVTTTFIDLLSDASDSTRTMAIDILGQLGDERAVEPLVNTMISREEESVVAALTIYSLGEIAGEKAAEKLFEMLESGHPSLRAHVIESLVRVFAKALSQKEFVSGDDAYKRFVTIFRNAFADDVESMNRAAATGLILTRDARLVTPKVLSYALDRPELKLLIAALADIGDEAYLDESFKNAARGVPELSYPRLLNNLAADEESDFFLSIVQQVQHWIGLKDDVDAVFKTLALGKMAGMLVNHIWLIGLHEEDGLYVDHEALKSVGRNFIAFYRNLDLKANKNLSESDRKNLDMFFKLVIKVVRDPRLYVKDYVGESTARRAITDIAPEDYLIGTQESPGMLADLLATMSASEIEKFSNEIMNVDQKISVEDILNRAAKIEDPQYKSMVDEIKKNIASIVEQLEDKSFPQTDIWAQYAETMAPVLEKLQNLAPASGETVTSLGFYLRNSNFEKIKEDLKGGATLEFERSINPDGQMIIYFGKIDGREIRAKINTGFVGVETLKVRVSYDELLDRILVAIPHKSSESGAKDAEVVYQLMPRSEYPKFKGLLIRADKVLDLYLRKTSLEDIKTELKNGKTLGFEASLTADGYVIINFGKTETKVIRQKIYRGLVGEEKVIVRIRYDELLDSVLVIIPHKPNRRKIKDSETVLKLMPYMENGMEFKEPRKITNLKLREEGQRILNEALDPNVADIDPVNVSKDVAKIEEEITKILEGFDLDPGIIESVPRQLSQKIANSRLNNGNGNGILMAIGEILREEKDLRLFKNLREKNKQQVQSQKGASEGAPGGIDMNPNALDLRTEGPQIEFDLPLDPAQWENLNFEGLTPVILQIHITNFPEFVGTTESYENVALSSK